MAYQENFLEEDDQNGQSGGQVLGSNDISNSVPGSSAGTSPLSQKQQKGSGFTNLSQYVDANKEQSAGLAGSITSGISKGVDEAKSGAESFVNDTNSLADKNTTRDSGLISTLQNSPDKLADQQWKDVYASQTAGYKGPQDVTSLTPYQDLNTKFKASEQKVKSLDDPYAIKQTIADQNKTNSRTYSGGENTLDAFLATSGAGADTLNNYKQEYATQNPLGDWNSKVEGLNSHLAQAKQTSEGTKAATEQAYGNSLSNLRNTFANESAQATAEKAKADKDTKDLMSRLSGRDSEAYKSIGLDPNAAKWLESEGYNVSGLVNSPTQSRSLGDIASDREVSGYQALLGLAPGSQSEYNFSKTGAAGPSQVSYDKTGIGSANQANSLLGSLNDKLKSEQAKRDAEYNSILEAISGLSDKQYGVGNPNSKGATNYASSLGISPEDYMFAAANGINPQNLASKGSSLKLGDVSSDSDRATFSSLLSQLGLSDPSLQDIQNEGSSYNLNLQPLKDSIASKRAQLAKPVPVLPVSNLQYSAKAPGVLTQISPSSSPGTPVQTMSSASKTPSSLPPVGVGLGATGTSNFINPNKKKS